MSNYYIRYRGFPIKFSTMGARDIADQVQEKDVTIFSNRDAACSRSLMQWGDVAYEHIEICTVGAAWPATRKKTTIKADKSVREKQTELL